MTAEAAAQHPRRAPPAPEAGPRAARRRGKGWARTGEADADAGAGWALRYDSDRGGATAGEADNDDDECNPFEYASPPTLYELTKLFFFAVSGLALLRLVLFLLVFLGVMICCFVGTLGLDPRRATEQPYSWWRRLAISPVPYLCRAALFVFGFYHIPVHGKLSKDAAFLVPNHVSVFDALIMFWLAAPAAVAKAELFKNPVLGRVLMALQVIPVKREDDKGREWTKTTMIKFAKSQANAKRSERYPQVLIFPQGTTTREKALSMFQRGAFLPGLPVQPVVLDYSQNKHFSLAYLCTRKKDYFFRRHFTQFAMFAKVTFLPLHRPSEDEKADATLFANNVRQSIADALDATTTDHYFEDAKLFRAALDLKEEKHVLSLLERPERSHRVHMGHFQLSDLKSAFKDGKGFKLSEVKEALRMFEALDSNGDGAIDFHEFCDALGLNPEVDHTRILFNLFDQNETGKINFKELVLCMALCTPNSTISVANKAKFAFSVFDDNDDGKISEAELEQLLAFARGGAHQSNPETDEFLDRFKIAAEKFGAEKGPGGLSVTLPTFEKMVEDDPGIVQQAMASLTAPVRHRLDSEASAKSHHSDDTPRRSRKHS